MSAPIDLTTSDDESISSQPRSKGKNKAYIVIDDDDDVPFPSKRIQQALDKFAKPSTPSRRRRTTFSAFKSEEHTPAKTRKHSTNNRGSRRSTESSSSDEDEVTYSSTKKRSYHAMSTPSSSPTYSPPRTISSSPTTSSPPTTPSSSPTSNKSGDGRDDKFEFGDSICFKTEHTAYRRVAKLAPIGYELVSFAPGPGSIVQTGTTVELRDGTFLRVKYIFWHKSKGQDDPGAYILRGLVLRRNSAMDGLFPQHPNELVAIVLMPMEDQRPHLIAGLRDRALVDCTGVRTIRFTNADDTRASYHEDDEQEEFQVFEVDENAHGWTVSAIRQEAPLVCNAKFVQLWDPTLKMHSTACLRLEPEEVDERHRRCNARLLRGWYRETRGGEGGEGNGVAVKGDMVDLYCGSGGASEAARMAGVKVIVAVDNKECASLSHQRNHPQCLTMLDDVSDIIALKEGVQFFISDICHSSNPCQYWSQLHTNPGKEDFANMAAAYMAHSAAKNLGCRVMIFEQAPGFSRIKKHRRHWNMFIHQFTSMGWSVKWRYINTADYGCPQARWRLWVYAVAPGQKMPDDIEPTHGPPGSGLLPYVTVRQALASIPATATLHDPAAQAEKFLRTGRPDLVVAGWDQPLKHLITTQGPLALHPDKRPFTIREVMCLQGFPVGYELIGRYGGSPNRTEAMKMIGDAVAPGPSKFHYLNAKEALRVTDEEMAT